MTAVSSILLEAETLVGASTRQTRQGETKEGLCYWLSAPYACDNANNIARTHAKHERLIHT